MGSVNRNINVQIQFSGTKVKRWYESDESAVACRHNLEENRHEMELELVNVRDHKERMAIIATWFLQLGRTGTK